MKLIKEEVNQKNKYEKLFDEMLEYMEFRLVKYPDGTFGLIDLQGGNLGNIEDDRFDNALQLLDRLDIYYDDYFINPIADELKDKGIESFHKDFSIVKFRDELPDSEWDFDVLDMVINHPNDIDLNNCYREDDLIGESLKEAKENKIILNDAQKKKVLDYLFGEFDIYTFYKDKLDREWYITDDKSLDPVRSDSDDAAFPMVLVIDGEFVDALTKEFADKITSLKESTTLTERAWRYTLKSGIKLRRAIQSGDYEDIRQALIDCYDELLDKGFIDEYDHDDWTEEVRDFDFESEDDVDFELEQLYDLCDNIDVFVALDFDESLEEDWYVFEYESGANPYIAKSERERDRIIRKYQDRVEDLGNGNYIIHDRDEDLFSVDMNESLEGKDRKKFITLFTNELQKEPLAYSKDEANDIAIKRADALGKNPYDSIEALVKSEVSKTRSKKDESLNESAGDFCKHYTRDELLAHSKEVYMALLPEDKILLGSPRPVETDRDFAYAGTIVCDGDYLRWRHFGSSANDATLEDFEWIINNIFDDCKYFILCPLDTYYDRKDKHYKDEFEKRNASLKEDTVKRGNSWVNKGKEGTHGKFKTKKAADAQRKAMFANSGKNRNFGENLKEEAKLGDREASEELKHPFAYFVGDRVRVINYDRHADVNDPDFQKSYEGRNYHKFIGATGTIVHTDFGSVPYDSISYEVKFDTPIEYDWWYSNILRSADFYADELELIEPTREGRKGSGYSYYSYFDESLKESYNGIGYAKDIVNDDNILDVSTWERALEVAHPKDEEVRTDNLRWDWVGYIAYVDCTESGINTDVAIVERALADSPEGAIKLMQPAHRTGKYKLVKSVLSKNKNKISIKILKSTSTDKPVGSIEYMVFISRHTDNLVLVTPEDVHYFIDSINISNEKNPLKEGYFDTDFDNKKVRRDIIGWWDDVERWNEENGSPYSIDNGDTTNLTAEDVEDMLAAMFDMLRELKDVDKDLYKKGRRIYNKYAITQLREGKKLRESVEDNYVIFTEFDDIKGTPEDNYNAQIRNANKVINFSDDGFDSIEQVVDYVKKYFKVSGDIIVKDKQEESLKESKEEDLTADEIAYKKYQDGEYTYQDYVDVCTQEECEPLPEIKESLPESTDGKFAGYTLFDDKDEVVDYICDDTHTDDEVSQIVADKYPTTKIILKQVFKLDGKDIKEVEEESTVLKPKAKVEEKKEIAKDRVLAKKAKLKESNCSEPEEKPEFLHKGDWVWDDVACDWYDNNSGDYHLELVHNSELPFGDSDEDIQAVFGLKESADWTSDEILAIVDKLNADGIATTTNKGIADAYAANENPYRRFEVSKADDKDEWTIKVVWKDDTIKDDEIEESLENIPTITNLFGDYDF